MRSDEMGQEKKGVAPEPAAGAEPRLDEGFELDDETVGALASGGDDAGEHRHDYRRVSREKGLIWGYNELWRCTICGREYVKWT